MKWVNLRHHIEFVILTDHYDGSQNALERLEFWLFQGVEVDVQFSWGIIASPS